MKRKLIMVFLSLALLLGLTPSAFADVVSRDRDVLITVHSSVSTKPTTTHTYSAYSSIDKIAAPTGKCFDLRGFKSIYLLEAIDSELAEEMSRSNSYFLDLSGRGGSNIGNPNFDVEVLSAHGSRNYMLVTIYKGSRLFPREIGIRVYARSPYGQYTGPGWTQTKSTIKYITDQSLVTVPIENPGPIELIR